ncbi:YceI family protein [Arsenicicoccus dermatophilus]|uniref:YceI family protein n=1 Tax=Arsenicicoccus dermatophilus TaxID=1076331 RepID=UPI003916DDDA
MTTLQQLDGTYVVDPAHSRLGFVARHAMVTKVRGSVDEFEGNATTGPGLQGASIEITARMASVDTRNADRDAHLRAGDFFDVDTYPTMTFRSTSVRATGEDTLAVTGDLTIKDVTRPVTLDVEYAGAAQDPYGNERIGFEGSATILRSEFGITFNAALETGGVLVSDAIRLELEVSAVKQA